MDTEVIPATALPFTAVDMTRSINALPPLFGQFTAQGYFPAEPLATAYVSIVIENGVVSALPATGDGNPSVSSADGAEERTFKIKPVKHMDEFRAADIKNMLALIARAKSPETAANLMNKRLERLRRKFDITREWLFTTAAKGVILDGAGKVIYNLFEAFEVTKKQVFFNLGSATEDINSKCDLIWQLISQDLQDEVMTGVTCMVDRSFFNKLINHAKVEKYWLASRDALLLANMNREQDGVYRPRTITFGNITFQENSAVIPMWGGTNRKVIDTDTGHAFPTGTVDSHVTYVAPPDDIRMLDGQPADVTDLIHVTTEAMKHGAGMEILGQMHALPIWRRPKLLVEVSAGSGSSTTPVGD